jgi:ribosome-associated protein
VLATGRNKRHLKSMRDEVRQLARDAKRRIREEGTGESAGAWVLIDLGDVIVHLFDAATRDYYDIDGLWADAPRVDVD